MFCILFLFQTTVVASRCQLEPRYRHELMSSIVVLRSSTVADAELATPARPFYFVGAELESFVRAAAGPLPALADIVMPSAAVGPLPALADLVLPAAAAGPLPALMDLVMPSAAAGPLPALVDLAVEEEEESSLDTDEENQHANEVAAAAAGSQCKNCGDVLEIGLAHDQCPSCVGLIQIFDAATDGASTAVAALPTPMPMDVDAVWSGGGLMETFPMDVESVAPDVGLVDDSAMDVESMTFEVNYANGSCFSFISL
jgi:hypothetical protein